jgi:glycogen synthase
MQAAGMAKDFGWGPAAKEYAAIYRKIVTGFPPTRE